ncbi:MAG: FG-GAP repeat protein [Phycisphaerales bacterium]
MQRAALIVPAAACLAAVGAWGAEGPPVRWRPLGVLEAASADPAAVGPCVAFGPDGRFWIGPSRDMDVGDGPTRVQAVTLPPAWPSDAAAWMTLTHPGADRTAGIGAAIACTARVVAVGAPHAGCGQDACDAGQVLLHVPGQRGATILAPPSTEPGAQFGAAVAAARDLLAVGSPRADGSPDAVDAGTVDVFDITAGPDGTLHARPIARLVPPTQSTSGRFGTSIATDGDRIAVGEPGAGTGTPRPGAVHVFRRHGGAWRLEVTLRASAGAVGWHGAAVALAGANLLVGAPVARPWGAGTPRVGAVEHWQLSPAGWRRVRTISPDDAASDGAGFGSALAILGDTAAIGSPGDDLLGEDAGAAYVCDLATGRADRLEAQRAGMGDGLGASLSFGLVPGLDREQVRLVLAVAGSRDPESAPQPGTVECFTPGPLRLAGARGSRLRHLA